MAMRSAFAVLLLACASAAFAQDTAATWIWYPENPAADCVKETRWFRRSFDLPEGAMNRATTLLLMVDDNQKLWVNGRGDFKAVETGRAWNRYDLTGALQAGRNVLALQGTNGTGPAGVIARLTLKQADGTELVVNSDASWRATKAEPPTEWTQADYDDSTWAPVRVIGNAFTGPWYGHELFDVEAFITDAEKAAYQRHMDTLLVAPEKFANEPPARAAIKRHNGAPALFINDQPRPLVMYRATLDPISDYGRHLIAQFRDAGIHGYAPYIAMDRCWKGPGQYDWRLIDEQVRAYLSVDPDAYLDILVRLVPPPWWFDARPGEMVRYATSDKIDGLDEAERVLRPSPASEVWRRDAGAAWTALIRHMEAQPWGKRVIGWHACYGIYAEWHYFGSWTLQYPDTGEAMTKAFRAYLREKYGTDAKLQAAWGERVGGFVPEPAAGARTHLPTRLDTAQVPGLEPRRDATLASFRDPTKEQRVIDYYRCQHKVTADAIELFGKLAKDATGGRAIYGIYYGYFMGVGPQAQGGHLDLLRLMKSPVIDYFVAPYEYGSRLMGMDGRLRSLAQAFELAGKAHIIEADTRTHLHSREEYGRVQNLTESLAALRREFSTALVEHTGYWYVDFGPESVGGWFDHPEMMSTIKDLHALATRTLAVPRKSTAEVALVCDLQSAYYLSDGEGMLTAYKLIMDTTEALYHTGTPFDELLLPQLATADLSRYKALIFLNTTAMSDQQAALVQKLRAAGKHAMVFLWAPGYTGPDGLSLARVQQITGFKVAQPALRAAARMVVTRTEHPLVRGLPAEETATIQTTGTAPVSGFSELKQWFNPRDKVFMEDHYSQFDFQPLEQGLTWTFQTRDAWSDIHWQGEIAQADGLGLEVRASSGLPQLGLRCVIKDANMAEFVSSTESLGNGEPRQLRTPFAAFTNAPWAQVRPEKPAFPLQGMKFVIDGLDGAGRATLELRNLCTLTGNIVRTKICRFGEGTFGPLVTPVAAPGVEVLGHIEGRQDGLLAVRGKGTTLTVYCPVPFLPREVLAAVLAQAGVRRIHPADGDVVRADSRLMAVHTKDGGPRKLTLPGNVSVSDAITGAKLGAGATLDVTLPPNSTTILEMTATRQQ